MNIWQLSQTLPGCFPEDKDRDRERTLFRQAGPTTRTIMPIWNRRIEPLRQWIGYDRLDRPVFVPPRTPSTHPRAAVPEHLLPFSETDRKKTIYFKDGETL